MSQSVAQQMGKQPEEDAAPTQWTFSVNITTCAAFDPNAYRIITGAATINLRQNASGGYTGTMQFNAPTMTGDPNATQGQKQWSQRAYPLVGITYASGILSFTVPGASAAFGPNFNAADGNPTPPHPAGPPCGPFQFAGSWDGVSTKITGGCCWVPSGWLMDAGGVFGVGAPPPASCPPQPGASASGGGDGGGGDPPMGSWGSDGG
jgi:hypothetical protein